MSDYLSRKKVLALCAKNNATYTIRDIEAGKADPDPIILGDGSEARVGDVVLDPNGYISSLLAHHGDFGWVTTNGCHYTVTIYNLKALPEPDSREKVKTDAARIVSDLCLSMGAEKDFLALLDRAFALAGVVE
jgi:hypothetical protein